MSNDNFLLSVDTSLANGGLSLYKDKKLIGESTWGADQPHSETLTGEFQNLLNQLGLSPTHITEVLCSYGPGSFTGLRVGLNFAKSICYVNKIQITLSPSFRSFLNAKKLDSDKKHSTYLVLLNAYKNQLFVADYTLSKKSMNENIHLSPLNPETISQIYDQHKELIVLGDGYDMYQDDFSNSFKKKCTIIPNENFNPSIHQAQIFFNYDHCLKFLKIDPLLAEPLYIKKSEAEENLNRGQLKKHSQRKL